LKFLFCFSMYIAKKALKKQFDPRKFPQETYLLCMLHWGESDVLWIHWVRNDDDRNRHAEEYFLEEIFEARSSRSCHITWYLSWSPCAMCCYRILDFLQSHPNVNIDIRVARLYYIHNVENRRGLRALDSLSGVTIRAMDMAGKAPHALDCWENFRQGHGDDDSWPRNFQQAIARNRLTLSRVLEVSTL
ncbi:ABEC1 enzyme, partial [Dasyornis broadbenti]|nr:ABEC1 enzyme [Dasyornis broadbenti]